MCRPDLLISCKIRQKAGTSRTSWTRFRSSPEASRGNGTKVKGSEFQHEFLTCWMRSLQSSIAYQLQFFYPSLAREGKKKKRSRASNCSNPWRTLHLPGCQKSEKHPQSSRMKGGKVWGPHKQSQPRGLSRKSIAAELIIRLARKLGG